MTFAPPCLRVARRSSKGLPITLELLDGQALPFSITPSTDVLLPIHRVVSIGFSTEITVMPS
jgi:hypothetical protein